MYLGTFFLLAAFISGVFANYEYNLNGTIAIVTGGAKGIGYEIVKCFLKGGVQTVYIIGINNTRGMQAESELNCKYGPKRAVFICADVTKDLDRVTQILQRSGVEVDILVNNAGILNEYDANKTIYTNAIAPMLWSRRYIEIMRKDKGGKGGTIINISSLTAYIRDPFYPYYETAKCLLLGFTFCMGHMYNFLTQGVRMFAICPGLTYTDLSSQRMLMENQEEVFEKFISTLKWQKPCAVGKAAALLYKTAKTGTAYTAEGYEAPFESPDRIDVTVENLLSLE